MTLRELTSLTGIAERQIRYLVAEGFMPAPRGGRAHAEYGEDHVAAIGRYMALRRTGLLPSAIKLLLDGARGCANEREFWKLQAQAARLRALIDDDVEPVIFHRRI